MFLDADDWLPSDYIRPCRAPLDAAPDVAFAFTQLHYFGDRDGGSNFPVFDPNRRKRGSCIPSSALMRSDVVRRHGYDVRLRHGLEDWAFYLTLAENGVAGVLVADTHVWHRVHGSSMGHRVQRDRRRRQRTYLRILRKHRRLLGIGATVGMVARSAGFRRRSRLGHATQCDALNSTALDDDRRRRKLIGRASNR
jgi:GT2 family glycosyltransferase